MGMSHLNSLNKSPAKYPALFVPALCNDADQVCCSLGWYALESPADAKEAGKPVSIFVETFNPSLRLFQRLGFTPVQQEGFHLLLQCAG